MIVVLAGIEVGQELDVSCVTLCRKVQARVAATHNVRGCSKV